MSGSKKLSKRQLAVLEDLFTSGLDEPAVLEEHAVSRTLFERWLADERFTKQLEQRIVHAYRESRIVLARHAPQAAGKLVALTKSKKEDIARKACLDIIALHDPTSREGSSDISSDARDTPTVAGLSPETASRLLAALARSGQPGNDDSP